MAKTEPGIFIALTLDADPDANRPVPGRSGCISAGFKGRVSLKGTRRGLGAINGILVSLGLPATIFWEARTLNVLARTDPQLIADLLGNDVLEHACHGLRHEDLTAPPPGNAAAGEERKRWIATATGMIAAHTGQRPVGFRAPYCRVDDAVLKIVAEHGYRYDASMTVDAFTAGRAAPFWPAAPAAGGEHFREIPLLRWRDREGQPISGYLWQLLEGRRKPEDYIAMVREVGEKHPGRLIQLALHPWHLAVKEDGWPMEDTEHAAGTVRMLLESLPRRARVCFTTVEGYLERLTR